MTTSRCLESSHHSYPISRSISRTHQPHIGSRFPRPQARDGGIVVLVNFVVSGFDIDGDEFAVVLRAKRRTYLLIEDISPQGCKLIQRSTWLGGWHDSSSRRLMGSASLLYSAADGPPNHKRNMTTKQKFIVFTLLLLAPFTTLAAEAPNDVRLQPLKDLNGVFPFTPPKTKALWDQ